MSLTLGLTSEQEAIQDSLSAECRLELKVNALLLGNTGAELRYKWLLDDEGAKDPPALRTELSG